MIALILQVAIELNFGWLYDKPEIIYCGILCCYNKTDIRSILKGNIVILVVATNSLLCKDIRINYNIHWIPKYKWSLEMFVQIRKSYHLLPSVKFFLTKDKIWNDSLDTYIDEPNFLNSYLQECIFISWSIEFISGASYFWTRRLNSKVLDYFSLFTQQQSVKIFQIFARTTAIFFYIV